MDARKLTQEILDAVLLKYGIMSHHIKRVEVDSIAGGGTINNDEYVVYRVISTPPKTRGDGADIIRNCNVDINYYYKYNRRANDTRAGVKRMDEIEAAFRNHPNCRIANGQSDLYDTDAGFRGINIEVRFWGVVNG